MFYCFTLRSPESSAVLTELNVGKMPEENTGRSRFTRFSFCATYLLTRIDNLQHFSNSRDKFRFNAHRHWRYAIFFGLTRSGVDDLWPHLSRV